MNMSKLDALKTGVQMRKIEKQLKKQVVEVEGGGGAVVVEMTGEQKIKKIYIDPDRVDLQNIEELERWLEEAIREAHTKTKKIAEEKLEPHLSKLKPYLSKLGF